MVCSFMSLIHRILLPSSHLQYPDTSAVLEHWAMEAVYLPESTKKCFWLVGTLSDAIASLVLVSF